VIPGRVRARGVSARLGCDQICKGAFDLNYASREPCRFYPYRGHYAARLGGYEGVEDAITQTVTIPIQGELIYWWEGKTYETFPHHDPFEVALLNPDGTLVTSLAHHDNQDVQDTWQRDVVDVSAYTGQSLTLRFYSYNDNYYFTVFNLDEIYLTSVSSR
jgi:hypothetical protein